MSSRGVDTFTRQRTVADDEQDREYIEPDNFSELVQEMSDIEDRMLKSSAGQDFIRRIRSL